MIEYHRASLGLDQIIRILWQLMNNPKLRVKEKLNALKSLRQCTIEKLLITSYIVNDRIFPYIQNQMEGLSERENEVERRERVLEDYCKEHSIEFDLIDPNSGFIG